MPRRRQTCPGGAFQHGPSSSSCIIKLHWDYIYTDRLAMVLVVRLMHWENPRRRRCLVSSCRKGRCRRNTQTHTTKRTTARTFAASSSCRHFGKVCLCELYPTLQRRQQRQLCGEKTVVATVSFVCECLFVDRLSGRGQHETTREQTHTHTQTHFHPPK